MSAETTNNEAILHKKLRDAVEQTAARKMVTPKDFDFLSGMIYERTREMINSFTLKRFWGYIERGGVSRTTLDILSHFAGYTDWNQFSQIADNPPQQESGMIAGTQISTRELQPGDCLRLRWQPDREVMVRFEGLDLFTIIDSQGSKLQVGSTFHSAFFVSGQPLILNCLVMPGQAPCNYACGSSHGIQFELIRGGSKLTDQLSRSSE